jgi:hypothetical protein
MAYPRERRSISTRSGGTCGRFTWWPDFGSGTEVNSAQHFARDSVGWEDNYPLDFDFQNYEGGTMNQAYSGYFTSWFYNWVPEILRAGFNLSHLHTPSDSDVDPYYATKAVARSNPSKPYVDLPVEIGQMHEVAGLLKRTDPRLAGEISAGVGLGGIPNRAAGHYLAYSFGTIPIAQAIYGLATAHGVINKRVKEVRRLVASGMRKTMQMDLSSAQSREYWYIDTAHSTAGGYFDIATLAEVRAHVRWGLYPGAFQGHETPDQMDAEIRALSRRAVTGGHFDLFSAWQLIPFSWLLDWFLGIGDYLESQRNVVNALLKEVTIMRHRKTWAKYKGETYEPGGGASTMRIAPINMVRESKSRRFSFPSPLTAHLPLLGSREVTTIASIAMTR